MKITVVLPTNRPSGFNLTFSALHDQSLLHDDFELILIDDYKDREKLAIEYAKSHDVKNLKYIKSKPNYWRSNRLIANARNTSLIYAEAELVVFVDDYIWFPPRFLEEHWKVYKRTQGRYTMVGGSKAVKYAPNQVGTIDKLPLPEVKNHVEGAFIRNIAQFKVSDTRGEKEVKNCGGQWFYTCNASAPLSKIIEVNGFDEQFDLCSEEDINLGLRLEKVGCRFWYRPQYNCTIFHMDHRPVDLQMKSRAKKYKEVTYEELRKRGTLESNPDEVQLAMKETYGVKYDGSWGLHEFNRKRFPYANEGIFNLKEERQKRGYWT